ncbi:hypothetical protein SAMN03159476_00356 [Pseudomonas sp. NFPP05]|uniref:hypothetical protein n=1 Tax=unclassified Pseudomonas TaxID=196821 RepID=UPI00087E2C12|nr:MULTISPECIES: hypothetical protein [unclassified Pseudomonas]SDA11011.1 hypothetical protein SAMN03159465_00356 [Pseudomonas sp. NFPP12]SFM11720.1 hypothetical protein SAMN03159476_00356 [Pseudomonas sp. NFPP05]
MSDKMREEFEAWARTGIDPLVDGDFRWVSSTENYYWASTRAMWESWKASRESLVVELPDDGIEDCRKEWPERGEKYGYDTFDTGYLYACKKHEEAIESLGLRVKP